MKKPKGKGKNQDLIPTKPLRPVASASYHRAQLEVRIEPDTGEIQVHVVCECGEKTRVTSYLVKGFHGAPEE